MIRTLVSQDLTVLRREKLLYLVLLVALAAAGYSVYSGSVWKASLQQEFASTGQAQAGRLEAEREQLAGIESGSTPITRAASAGLPNSVTTELMKPPGPLAELSIGDSDLRPARATIKALGRADHTFRFYQLENPALLALGRFDLSFVVIYLLPLLILAATYNVLSADRESGSLQLLLSQPVSAALVAWVRVGLRGGLVVTTVVAGALLAWWIWAPPATAQGIAPRLAAFMLVAAAYGALWCSLAAWVAAANQDSDSNALKLLLAWVLITLVLPSTISVLAQTFNPTPSRLHYVTTARQAENQANAEADELLAGYLLDHPELEVAEKSAVAPFVKTATLVQQRVDAAVTPVLDEFEQRLDQQLRLTGRLSLLSPASLTTGALAELAGTSLKRHRQFESQARALRTAWLAGLEGPLIAGRRLTLEEFDRLPRPTFDEPALAAVLPEVGRPLLLLLIYTAAAALLAERRFRRFAPAAA